MQNIELELLDKDVLFYAIECSKKDIAILVGSPLSAADGVDSRGIPTVQGMIELIEEHIRSESENLLSKYKKTITHQDSIEKYQASFKFTRDHLGQDEVNKIIEKATLRCVKEEHLSRSSKDLNKDENAWNLPAGTEFLAQCVVKSKKHFGPIITTNFDPLISIALKKNGASSHQTIMPTDGNINHHRTIDDRNIQVIHLHGYWTDSETLHTPDQLTNPRPQLKSSLSSIIKNKVLLVIGYGGWDDIFMEALALLAVDDEEKIDILWAFYEDTPELVQVKYKRLLETVKKAKIKGRFRAFGGINCHDFFRELHEKISLINTPDDVDDSSFINGNIDQGEIKAPKIPRWRFHYEPAHDFIREAESFQLNELLTKNSVISITSEWGLAKLSFISSFIARKFNKEKLERTYYVDLETCKNRDDILRAVKNQLGVELSQVAISLAGKESAIIFDNIESDISDEENKTTAEVTIELSTALTEFNELLNVILISRKNIINNQNATIKLDKLNDFDTKKYIENHSESKKNFDPLFLDKVIQVCNGIPMKMDRLLAELSLASFQEVIEQNHHPQPYVPMPNEPIPSALSKIINELSLSLDHDSVKSYRILKVLSVLSYGDTFTNIKRIYPTSPFTLGHLSLLKSFELIQSSDISGSDLEDNTQNSKHDLKIISIPPAIRDFIFNTMNDEEIYEIINNAADAHFGAVWRIGRIKLSPSTEHLIKSGNKNIGSSQIIAVSLLRCSLEKSNKVEINRAVMVASAFAMCLDKNSRFKELAHFSEEIFSLLKNYPESLDLVKLKILYGKSLRMIQERDKALEILNQLLETNGINNNADKAKILLNLAFLYEKSGDEKKAIEHAKAVIQISGKRSAYSKSAEAIIINLTNNNRLQKLRKIEAAARKANQTVNANNAALDIAKEEISDVEKMACYDRIIMSNGDNYNKFRTIGMKLSAAFHDGTNFKINNTEKSILYSAYLYSHSQRMSSIFNDTHKAIWLLYKHEENILGMIKLFRLSSLYWRICGESRLEKYYAVDLKKFLVSFLKELNYVPEKRYVQFRIEQIA